MARIRIELPDHFTFATTIPIRITDLNYGGHVGNDAVLSIIHEARMQYLNSIGYTETSFAGLGLIMGDAAIEFRQEIFYGDKIIASIQACELSRVSFELFYKLETAKDGVNKIVAVAKTGMVCYDYKTKKITAIPAEAKALLDNLKCD